MNRIVRTFLPAALLATATVGTAPEADAALTFPLVVNATMCFEVNEYEGWCEGTGYRLFADGTVRGVGGGPEGTWAILRGTFFMTTTADWDGDGRTDWRHDYLGAPSDRCMRGAVRDMASGLVGDFSFCP